MTIHQTHQSSESNLRPSSSKSCSTFLWGFVICFNLDTSTITLLWMDSSGAYYTKYIVQISMYNASILSAKSTFL